MKLSGWGRYPVADCRVIRARGDTLPEGALIARGAGRSYGDSALNPRATLDMRGLNRMLAFDPATGVLEAEAGVTLADIVTTFLPRGWFPRVTPGTQFVTLGGMIAADVHGKNHHADGSFASCVDWIEVLDAEGRLRRCSPTEETELFSWTLGGMGLTGVILRAAIRLRAVQTAHVRQRTQAAASLAQALEIFEATADATYSVAWIDCLSQGAGAGRSLVMTGEHATLGDLPPRMRDRARHLPRRAALPFPVDLPALALNRHTIGAFNEIYFRRGARPAAADRLVPAQSYFYPLDAVTGWNRMYGRRGFMQFQCLLPPEASAAGLAAILRATGQAGLGSFLAVLKRMGPGRGGLSFPGPGYTLALDFPVSDRSLALMRDLDAIVIDHGGRFYLAKDARMSAATLRRTDPRADQFADWRRRSGAAARFRSAQSERLEL